MTEALVLDDRCRVDALVLVEGAVGKHMALGSHLQPAIREVVQIDVLAGEAFAQLTPLQDDLFAVVGQGELIANMPLFAVAENVVEPGGLELERLMQVVSPGRPHREPFVETVHEPRQEHVAALDAGYVLDPQLFHQPVLQRAVGSFDATLCLAGLRADDLDVQLRQRTAELRHAGTALRLRPVHTKHRVLVGVERDGTAVCIEVAAQRFESSSTCSPTARS